MAPSCSPVTRWPLPSRDELAEDPHPHLARLRAEAPVVWVPALDAWLAVGRDAAVEVMRDAERFTVDDPRFTTGQVVGPSMLSLDGLTHDRHRAPFAAAFRPSASSADLSAALARRAAALVAKSRASRSSDLRFDVAAPLPAATIVDVLGLIDVTAEQATRWYRQIVDQVAQLTADPNHLVDSAVMAPLTAAVGHAIAADGTLAALRRQSDLDDQEFAAHVGVVMFGALETAESMIANLLWHVLQRRDVVVALQADPSRRDRAVEESLRLEPGAAVVDRFATVDTLVAGVLIAASDPVTVSLAAANRDPAAYVDPDVFSLKRENEPSHLSFVVGPHACIGTHLARAEARAVLDAVLDAPTVPVLKDVAESTPRGLVFRKPDRLLVDW
jgi:cytochrome P450